ncbi:hypothetical protein HQ529_03210, partial [Candidatus Woesearchaeota archaeon]|nr:hypothetical protein [Candidatus Woesearchaeota archaeon]
MKSKIFLLIIMLILGSSFASAGLWDWLTGLVTGNETILPQTIYVDKAESFSLRVGDTAIFLISGHERKITLTQINGDTAYVIYNYKANTGEQYTETTSINIGEIYIPDASYKINSLLMNDTSANFMFETFPSLPLPELDEGCTTIARSAIFDAERHWENLGLDTSQHSEIKHYRIRWFNGYWSRWYEAGFDDKDWKVNGDGSRRRVWSYFRDHYHQYVECAEAEPEPEPGVYSCSDSDGGTDLDVAGTVTISVSNGTASETVDDICSSNGMLTERYCTSAGGVATFANYYYDCPQGCSNGACINETEPEENISCSSNSDCPETSHQNSPYFCSGNDILKNYFSYECANPGTPESYCDESIEPRVINSCVDGASYCVELHSSCYSLNNLITNDILCSDTAYECPAGCLTVACTANETESGVYSCSDSDGGTDLDVAGTITISVSNGTASETVDDICSSNGMLTERYCTSAGGVATFANYYYDCPQGC